LQQSIQHFTSQAAASCQLLQQADNAAGVTLQAAASHAPQRPDARSLALVFKHDCRQAID
jgi:hypothetical protein